MSKKLKIRTGNQNPNFTIVLPGVCQAKCDFCFFKQDKNDELFLKGLKKALKKLPDMFYQISITGGEPTISPVFDEAMTIIRKFREKGKIRKVVLTTNGLNLVNKNLEGIDHINISRHHFDQTICENIFKTKKIPNSKDLVDIAAHANKIGIDINYNIVMVEENKDLNIFDFSLFAKMHHATSLTFRNQYGDYSANPLEEQVIKAGYKASSVQTCPVCRTSTYLVHGLKVKFHSSDYEPTESDKFHPDEVYEVVLQQNGDLTRDWEGQKILLNHKDF